jgi:hypothetical protein
MLHHLYLPTQQDPSVAEFRVLFSSFTNMVSIMHFNSAAKILSFSGSFTQALNISS